MIGDGRGRVRRIGCLDFSLGGGSRLVRGGVLDRGGRGDMIVGNGRLGGVRRLDGERSRRLVIVSRLGSSR